MEPCLRPPKHQIRLPYALFLKSGATSSERSWRNMRQATRSSLDRLPTGQHTQVVTLTSSLRWIPRMETFSCAHLVLWKRPEVSLAAMTLTSSRCNCLSIRSQRRHLQTRLPCEQEHRSAHN